MLQIVKQKINQRLHNVIDTFESRPYPVISNNNTDHAMSTCQQLGSRIEDIIAVESGYTEYTLNPTITASVIQVLYQ